MSKKLNEFPDFEGKKLMIALQKRGVECGGGANLNGLVAVVVGLINYMVVTKRLEDLDD
jgi:hypothetical protein